MSRSVGILGLGKYLPPRIVNNADIVAMGIDTSDEWIVDRTGIRERRIVDESMATSDMAVIAAQQAMERAQVDSKEIDLVIVATTSPDYLGFPSTACLVQDRLGLRNVGAFDLSAACSGFVYAMTTGAQFVETGHCKKVLVIGADCLSKWVDWTDRSSCILFGDGAGAAILGEVQPGRGIMTSILNSDGSEASILMIKEGGTRSMGSLKTLDTPANHIYMDGRSVFKVAVNTVVTALLEGLNKVGLTPQDIDLLVPHQANSRIIDYVRSKLGLSPEKVFSNIERYGNTSAASIPIALEEAVSEGRLVPGQIVATIGFGAGFTWATSILRWGV